MSFFTQHTGTKSSLIMTTPSFHTSTHNDDITTTIMTSSHIHTMTSSVMQGGRGDRSSDVSTATWSTFAPVSQTGGERSDTQTYKTEIFHLAIAPASTQKDWLHETEGSSDDLTHPDVSDINLSPGGPLSPGTEASGGTLGQNWEDARNEAGNGPSPGEQTDSPWNTYKIPATDAYQIIEPEKVEESLSDSNPWETFTIPSTDEYHLYVSKMDASNGPSFLQSPPGCVEAGPDLWSQSKADTAISDNRQFTYIQNSAQDRDKNVKEHLSSIAQEHIASFATLRSAWEPVSAPTHDKQTIAQEHSSLPSHPRAQSLEHQQVHVKIYYIYTFRFF